MSIPSDSPLSPGLEWSQPLRFSGAGAIGSPGGTHPIVGIGSTVHAAYAQGGQIHYRRSTDAGLFWSSAIPLTAGGTAHYPCSLELSGKALHLVWPDSRHGPCEIYSKRSPDGGDTWGPDARLTPGVDQFRLGTSVSGEALHIVWGTRRCVVPTPCGAHTWGEIYATRSLDGGIAWQPAIQLTQPVASAMRPAVAASGQDVYVTWFDRRDSTREWDWEIYLKHSADGGATWGPDIRMTETRTHARHPEIVAASGGIVCCIWEDGQSFDGACWGGEAALYASVSADRGHTWSPPRRITPSREATHAKVYACGPRIHLAWTDAPEAAGGPPEAYYMTSPDGGITWERPERLLSAARGAAGPVEAVGGTDLCAIVLTRQDDALCLHRRGIQTLCPPLLADYAP